MRSMPSPAGFFEWPWPYGAFSTILSIDGTNRIQVIASAGHDPANLKKYNEQFYALNCYEPLLRTIPVGRVITGSELAPRDWLKRQVFFNEWLVPSGDFSRGCTLTMAKDGDRLLRTIFDLPEKYASAEAETAKLLTRLGPHIIRAFELNETLGAARAISTSLHALLVSLDGAALILGANGRVKLLNDRAEAQLRSGRLLKLSASAMLTFASPTDQASFEKAKLSAIDSKLSAPQPFRIASSENGLIASVFPLRSAVSIAELGAASHDILLVIRPTFGGMLGVCDALQKLFQLTKREAVVIEAIGNGNPPARVADELGVSVLTVRNQLASAMAKMKVHRQAEIVAIVANLAPRLTGGSDVE